jgi:ADP-ribose pyrophosphatase YjhB (NUDIX family)
VREETGLETLSLELFGVFSDPSRMIAYPDGNVFRLLTLAFVVAVASGDSQISRESLELRFVPFPDIPDLEVGPALVPVLDAYLSSRDRPVVA